MQSQSAAQAIPFHTNGMRIGLLGGSFNPPHAAHRAISLFAIKRLKLDRVWWLLTPGNPLKDTGAIARPVANARAPRSRSPTIRASISAVSKLSSASGILSIRSFNCAAAFPACVSSGSWAPTISRSSIAGRTGGASLRGADRRDRPSAAEFSGACRPCRPGAGALPRARESGGPANRSASPRLGFPHRHETEHVIDRPPELRRQLEGKEVTVWFEAASGAHWNIETINPTCLI